MAVPAAALILAAAPAFAVPGNDNLADAVEASPLPFVHTADTRGATTETGELPPSCAPTGATVWYRLTAASPQRVDVRTIGSKFDTVVAVYRGSGFGDFVEVGCNDDNEIGQQSELNVGISAGQTYFVQIGGYEGAAGYMKVTIATALNDDFAEALVAEPLPATFATDTEDATTEPGEPSVCAPQGATVWYRVTLPADGTVSAETLDSDYDTVLTVYTGSSLASLSVVDCNDDEGTLQSAVSFPAEAGVTYHLQVGGYAGDVGSLVLRISTGPGGGPGPANDSFSSPVVIAKTPFFDEADTTGATFEDGEPIPSCVATGAATVWYRYTATADQLLIADTAGSEFDTFISIYKGPSLQDLQEEPLGCNDDVIPSMETSSIVLLKAVAGTTYYIQVGGWDGETGPLQFHLTPPV